MHEMDRLVVRWDAEHATIEAGKRAFTRPPGEPSMFAGTCLVLSWFGLLAMAAAALPVVGAMT